MIQIQLNDLLNHNNIDVVIAELQRIKALNKGSEIIIEDIGCIGDSYIVAKIEKI